MDNDKPQPLYPRERDKSSRCTGGCVGLRARMEILASTVLESRNVQPIPKRCIDYANPAVLGIYGFYRVHFFMQHLQCTSIYGSNRDWVKLYAQRCFRNQITTLQYDTYNCNMLISLTRSAAFVLHVFS